MQTNTLTFPNFLPGTSANRAPASSGRRLLRELRLPKDLRLLEALKARMPAHDPALRIERRLQKSAQRGRRIVLGSHETPYEPLVLDGAPLTALQQFEGLDIVVTTRSPEIREKLDLLVKLDRCHAVTVDMLVATCTPESTDLRERLDAVSTLAAEGLTLRLVATDLPESEVTPRAAAHLRYLFEEARESRAFDVTASGGAPEWDLLVQRLRLEYGFPGRLPGRG